MKANESIPNFDIKVREYTNYAIKSIKNVCKSFGTRLVGSEGDLKAQEYIVGDMTKWCDSVSTQDFTCRPAAMMGMVPFCAVLMILSILFYTFGIPIAGLLFSLAIVVISVIHFVLAKGGIFQIFFKKVKSKNCMGVINSKNAPKRRIIVSGHIDSAYENNCLKKGGSKRVTFVVSVCFASVVLSIAANIYSMVYFGFILGENVWSYYSNPILMVLAVLLYLTVPVLVLAMTFTNFKKPVLGANDDLSGSFVSLAVAKYLTDNNIRFDDTEVDVLITSGEEAGLCGSRAFVKENKDMLKSSDVETIFVSFDTIRDLEFAAAYNKDLNGLVKNDNRVADLLCEAAKNAGVEIKKTSVGFGATDSASFSQKKIPAATFSAMDSKNADYYHTEKDAPDNLSAQAIDAGVKIALETVFLYDEKGI